MLIVSRVSINASNVPLCDTLVINFGKTQFVYTAAVIYK